MIMDIEVIKNWDHYNFPHSEGAIIILRCCDFSRS